MENSRNLVNNIEDLKQFLNELQERIAQTEEKIRSFLPESEGYTAPLAEAMRYGMEAGGKKLRPILMEEAFHRFGGTSKLVLPFMAAIEMVHTHSLIHDDLPALDNDDYRRGRKTTHLVFGEAEAVLAGDALLNFAYESALQSLQAPYGSIEDAPRILRALRILSAKTGIFGMLGGQSVDVENDKNASVPMTKERLNYIYRKKTSALIEGSLMIGAALADAEEKTIAALETIGESIGLAFQIQDDLLDVTGTMEELGKPAHSDETLEKVTMVTMLGIEGAKKEVEALTETALEGLKAFGCGEQDFIYRLLCYLVCRRS